MTQYTLSKIAAAFFCFTTVLTYGLILNQTLLVSFGPLVSTFIVVTNFLLLAVSLIWFIWQKTHHDMPKKFESDILAAYANEQKVISHTYPTYVIDPASVAALSSSFEPIDIPLQFYLKNAVLGTIIAVKSSSGETRTIVRVLKKTEHTITLQQQMNG